MLTFDSHKQGWATVWLCDFGFLNLSVPRMSSECRFLNVSVLLPPTTSIFCSRHLQFSTTNPSP